MLREYWARRGKWSGLVFALCGECSVRDQMSHGEQVSLAAGTRHQEGLVWVGWWGGGREGTGWERLPELCGLGGRYLGSRYSNGAGRKPVVLPLQPHIIHP